MPTSKRAIKRVLAVVLAVQIALGLLYASVTPIFEASDELWHYAVVREIAANRRLPVQDRFDLYWMDHLPRAGNCTMSAVIGGQTTKSACDARRLPPLMRRLLGVS